MEIISGPGGGFEVRIMIPLALARTESSEELIAQ
jgi:hypothetical protein